MCRQYQSFQSVDSNSNDIIYVYMCQLSTWNLELYNVSLNLSQLTADLSGFNLSYYVQIQPIGDVQTILLTIFDGNFYKIILQLMKSPILEIQLNCATILGCLMGRSKCSFTIFCYMYVCSYTALQAIT